MIYRLLAFLLIAAPCFAQIDVDTFKTTSAVEDLIIKSKDPDEARRNYDFRNHGGGGGLTVSNGTVKSKTLVKINADSLRARVATGNTVRKAIYWIHTDLVTDTFTVALHRMLKQWREGTGTGADANYLDTTGSTWQHRLVPTGGRPTLPASAPTAMNWIDSGYTPTVKDQAGCNTCWNFAEVAQIEAVHKKDVFTGSTTYNAEDGTGADRSIAPIATDTGSVRIITETKYKMWKIPTLVVTRWFDGIDNGMLFMSDSGDVKITATEGGNGPIINLSFETVNDGIVSERTMRIIGTTNIVDTWLNSGAATTNYGGADSARVNSTGKYVIRTDSLRKIINDVYLPTDDTVQRFTAATCSLYCTKYTTASVKMYDMYKTHWIEGQATWNIWKTDYEWGTAGANRTDELDLSEEQVLGCIDGQDCNAGGFIEDILQFALTDSLLGERYLKYSGAGTSCPDNDTMADDARIGWAYPFKFASADSLKKLLTIQPLALVHDFHSTSPAFSSYIWSPTNLCYYNADETTTRHAELLVGFDDNFTCDAGEGTGAWIFKNQYGTNRGRDGIYYIAYNTDLDMTFHSTSGERIYILSFDSTATQWASPGGLEGTDYTTPGTVVRVGGVASTWYGIEIPVDWVQGWLNGNLTNYGMILTTGYTGSSASWTSSEGFSDHAYFQIWSAPVTTKIGSAKIGNVRIGQ